MSRSVSTGEWRRYHPTGGNGGHINCTFTGASQLNLAWSVGGGVSFELDDLLGREGYIDLSYRYTDFGQATGGDVSTGPGNSSPVEPFNFRLATHAVAVGLRFPLGN
jgi:opacity protein-like surface antigen